MGSALWSGSSQPEGKGGRDGRSVLTICLCWGSSRSESDQGELQARIEEGNVKTLSERSDSRPQSCFRPGVLPSLQEEWYSPCCLGELTLLSGIGHISRAHCFQGFSGTEWALLSAGPLLSLSGHVGVLEDKDTPRYFSLISSPLIQSFGFLTSRIRSGGGEWVWDNSGDAWRWGEGGRESLRDDLCGGGRRRDDVRAGKQELNYIFVHEQQVFLTSQQQFTGNINSMSIRNCFSHRLEDMQIRLVI